MAPPRFQEPYARLCLYSGKFSGLEFRAKGF